MSTTVAITVPVPSRRTILLSLVVLLLLGGVVWAVAAHAASTTASNAGVATVAKGKKVVVVPAGMDLNAESKAQATAMTASTVGVRSIVANAATDKLTITMTGRANKAIRVSWSVTNGSHPAELGRRDRSGGPRGRPGGSGHRLWGGGGGGPGCEGGHP